ncbi:MAG: protein of unknown function transrane [Marmoricola sp.]|nr:protein of unknown function transrane [Marmoricola sp.]
MTPRSRLGLLQVCAAGVLWGTGGLVVTVLNNRDGLGAMTVSAARMAIAAIALVLFAAVTSRLGDTWTTFRDQPLTVALVGVGIATYQGLYFVSVLMVGVSVATVVALGLAPVLVAAWEHLRARTRPSWREVGVLAAALVGLVLISATAGSDSSAPGDRPVLGLVLAVAAGLTYGATTVLGHGLAQHVEPISLTTGATAVGAVVLAPFFAVAALSGDPVLPASPVSLGLLVYLGVATMALSYGLLYAGLRTTSGSAATVATLVEPLSAAVLATVFLDERLPWTGVAGGVLILAAVAALGRNQEPPALPVPA